MSAAEDFDDMLGGQTVVVYARTGYSSYGVPAHSASGSTYKCRWVEKRGTVRDSQGAEQPQRGILWVMSTAAFSPDVKITLPDGTVAPILSVDSYPDELGRYHHSKLAMGYA